jgi:hypothetical protein
MERRRATARIDRCLDPVVSAEGFDGLGATARSPSSRGHCGLGECQHSCLAPRKGDLPQTARLEPKSSTLTDDRRWEAAMAA